MERLIDIYMRQTIDRSLLSDCQHAYTKGRSVETALHKLVNTLEYSIHHRKFSMVAFLDIEGAFNNIQPQAILNELVHSGVHPLLKSVIDQLLRCRIIKTTLGSQTIQRSVARGTPQGGVLSSLLWNIAINPLLLKLTNEGSRVSAYANDVAITISGRYIDTIWDLMQNALHTTVNWATDVGLIVSPDKTEVVILSRKHTTANIVSLVITGTPINISEEAISCLILDRKLSWKQNCQES